MSSLFFFLLLLSDTHFPNASVFHADYVKPLYHLWLAASGNVVHFSRYAAGVTQVTSIAVMVSLSLTVFML